MRCLGCSFGNFQATHARIKEKSSYVCDRLIYTITLAKRKIFVSVYKLHHA